MSGNTNTTTLEDPMATPENTMATPEATTTTTETTTAARGIKRLRKPLTAEAKTAKSMKNRIRRTHQGIQSEREIDRTRFSKFRIYLAVEFSLVYSWDCNLKYDLLNLIHKCNITCFINLIFNSIFIISFSLKKSIKVLIYLSGAFTLNGSSMLYPLVPNITFGSVVARLIWNLRLFETFARTAGLGNQLRCLCTIRSVLHLLGWGSRIFTSMRKTSIRCFPMRW